RAVGSGRGVSSQKAAGKGGGGNGASAKISGSGLRGLGGALGLEDLGLSAAYRELEERSRDLEARDLGLRLREEALAEREQMDRAREGELEASQEGKERELERARAEVYALQVKLREQEAHLLESALPGSGAHPSLGLVVGSSLAQ
ncbi:unnamed protein product, partial [Discosporangium mesarthrocarpum]